MLLPRESHAVHLATLALLALKAEVPPAQWILNAELTLPRWPSRKSPFDPACPNTPAHSRQGYLSHHLISASEVCLRVRDRLARDLDHGCECLDKHGMFGATGALFKMTDPTYGYIFVAKGVQEVNASTLADEALHRHGIEHTDIREANLTWKD